MKRIALPFGSLLIFFCFLGGCGSDEALEQYDYPLTKSALESAIVRVLQSDTHPGINWDTANIVVKRYKKSAQMDTIRAANYKGVIVWITIRDGETQDHYAFRYLGDALHWKNSPTSAIFITNVWNDRGLDIRQGEDTGGYSGDDAKKAKKLFETVFLSRLDRELHVKHRTGG